MAFYTKGEHARLVWTYTSSGYDGKVVEAEMSMLLFCSVHCLPDRSKVLAAKAIGKA
jgi:hypothetical protein